MYDDVICVTNLLFALRTFLGVLYLLNFGCFVNTSIVNRVNIWVFPLLRFI